MVYNFFFFFFFFFFTQLSGEASTFLEKRCKFPGKSITSVIPNATAPALDLITQLLSVNPALRPTAPQALNFPYLQGTETVLTVDYSRNYLSRPPRELFDFENEKYSLEELRGLIEGEVRIYENEGARIRQQQLVGQCKMNESTTYYYIDDCGC